MSMPDPPSHELGKSWQERIIVSTSITDASRLAIQTRMLRETTNIFVVLGLLPWPSEPFQCKRERLVA